MTSGKSNRDEHINLSALYQLHDSAAVNDDSGDDDADEDCDPLVTFITCLYAVFFL